MTEPTKNLPQTTEQPDIDHIIKALVKVYPEESTFSIGKKLKELGVTKHQGSIYHRLTKSECLRADIDDIKRNHLEFIHRELVPLANQAQLDLLKSKRVSYKDPLKQQVAKHVQTVAHKTEEQATPRPQQVNIEKIQVMMGNVCQERLQRIDNTGDSDG